jgi:hypothetical protein
VLIVYASSYQPSAQLFMHLKMLLSDFPSIQYIPINSDEARHLLGIPVLNIEEIPTVSMFFRGRLFCEPSSNFYHVTTCVKKLATVSMDIDEYEPVGTTLRIAHGLNTSSLKSPKTEVDSNSSYFMVSLLSPVWAIMGSLYDI